MTEVVKVELQALKKSIREELVQVQNNCKTLTERMGDMETTRVVVLDGLKFAEETATGFKDAAEAASERQENGLPNGASGSSQMTSRSKSSAWRWALVSPRWSWVPVLGAATPRSSSGSIPLYWSSELIIRSSEIGMTVCLNEWPSSRPVVRRRLPAAGSEHSKAGKPSRWWSRKPS